MIIWTLEEVRKHAEMVASLWNGDNSGKLEEAAMAAKDVLYHLDLVEQYLKEIEGMDESDVMLN
jgi:hypothetical protein